MTASELNATLAELGWSQRELSRRLGVDKMRVNGWATGEIVIPFVVSSWLGRLQAALRKLQPPLIKWD